MISDCAFFTGSTHPVCQDYTRHGKTAEGPYVLIADGCSSSPDTDIGARLLVMAAERYIDVVDQTAYHEKAIELAAVYARSMGLPETCLDATLLTIRIEKGIPSAMIFGDGFIATKKNGVLFVTKVSFPNNTPFYPCYKLNDGKRAKGKLQPAIVQEFEFHPEGLVVAHKAVELQTLHDTDFFRQYVDAGSDFVAIMSDGAGSFLRQVITETSKTNEVIPDKDILPEILGFKNFQAGFVQRRLKRLEKDNRERQWQHYDDLSVGALSFMGDKV